MRLLTAALAATVLSAGAAMAEEITGRFDRTLQVSGKADLDIETDAGGISVKPGSPGVVVIHAILKARSSHAGSEERMRELERNPPVEQSGNTIRIGHVRNLHGVSIRFEIQTPADSQLRARTDSGGIFVEGVSGPVDCKADSGGIQARNIGAEVRAQADSGGVQVHQVKGPVFVRADSGGIEATGVTGAVDLAADSGGIMVEQTAAAPVQVRADSGGAHIRLASSGGYDLNARSDSGRITVPEMTVRGTVSKSHIEGKLRGGGPLVDVQVDSGNIQIE